MANISVYGYDTAMSELIQSASGALVHKDHLPNQSGPLDARNDTGFPFLRLPSELREQVLHLVLPASSYEGYKGWVWQKGNTAILSTSRQMHDEGTRIMYSSNIFVVSLYYDQVSFLYRWYRPKLSATPHRSMNLYTTFASRYHGLMRRFNVQIYSMDDYYGMVNYGITNLGALALGCSEQLRKACEFMQKDSDDLEILVFFPGLTSGRTIGCEPYRSIVLQPLKTIKGKISIDDI
jgi:hypothetical protein